MKLPLALKVFFSPFKRPKLKWYFGKIAVGVPVFFPRKWVPLSKEDIKKKALESFNNPIYIPKSLEEWEKSYSKHRKHIPKKVGFDLRDLTWKTKFNQFRFEYNPVYSFVFFGYQIAVTIVPDNCDHYWECYLYYYFETDRKASTEARLKSCIKRFPCVWRSSYNGVETVTNYWPLILKKKWKNILF